MGLWTCHRDSIKFVAHIIRYTIETPTPHELSRNNTTCVDSFAKQPNNLLSFIFNILCESRVHNSPPKFLSGLLPATKGEP